MDSINKGAWVINTTKHLNGFKNNSHELDNFESTSFAGKASILLSKLTVESQEIIDGNKVKVFARDSYISPENTVSYLKALKNEGMVDYSVDAFDRPKEVEIYCFSNSTAIKTATKIFDERVDNEIENANIDLLESTYSMPMDVEEIEELLKNGNGYREENINILLNLHEVFKITKKNRGLIYNEYTFVGNQDKMISSIKNLSPREKEIVNEIINEVGSKQGYLYEDLSSKYDNNILNMMEGVGMIEGLGVESDIGSAVFVTTPQLKGNGVGKFDISSDIFHKAKILLSSLRFGQEKSTYGRGKISTEEKMLNIIRKLNRGEWLNPCTAAGKDYVLLETLGVVQVKPAHNGMYRMRLRQVEVGKLVEQMILYNKVVAMEQDTTQILNNMNATSIINPEERRMKILAESNPIISELQDKVLQSMRY